MSKPPASCRRIDHLKTVAYACGFCDDDARKFGKLTKTSTWEALLNLHGLEFEAKSETLPTTATASNIQQNSSCNLLEWVDFGQAFALALASVGFALLILGMFPRINPLNLFPVKITIQVGK